MRELLWVLFVSLSACDSPQPGEEGWDPFAEADEAATWQAPPPPVIALNVPPYLTPSSPSALVVDGDLGPGERVYFGATLGGTGSGPCIAAAGGLCLNLRNPVRLLGSAVADGNGVATFSWTPPPAIPLGATVTVQALVVRSIRGVDSILSAPNAGTVAAGPPEGSSLPDWVRFNFADNGYRDGCAGGAKYIKNNGYGQYVGVTLCGPREVKIWMSDRIYGTFVSTGDWSGSGEDHCEYVGGDFISMPGGSTAVDPGQPCWSRGPRGVAPVYEPVCGSNRWIAPSHSCTAPVPLPAGLVEGMALPAWTPFDFYDNGYRDGCVGGAKYVMSTPFIPSGYVGVTLCSASTYKIWLTDRLFGTFTSPGDWSGSGEDHCEYVGGSFVAFPGTSTAVDPGEPCWSRGPAGASPVYEASCGSNRWVPSGHTCSVAIP